MALTSRVFVIRPGARLHIPIKTAAQAHENSNGATAGDGPREKGLSQGRVINTKMTMVMGMKVMDEQAKRRH
ncbi:MAG: hypothetical protein V4713_13565 [Pseudomonadota bacterium]